jgi:hypothetical protein
MSEGNWNPWKLTAIGLALVMVTALVTGMVVANWTGRANDRQAAEMKAAPTAAKAAPAAQVSASPRLAAAPAAPVAPAPAAPARPSQSVIEDCNRYAAHPTTKDKTLEVVKDSAVAGLVGAAVGAAGGAIADGGKGAGKGAGIGGVVGLGAGALYGLNENRKNDERYREAYAACMRSRGYGG